MHAPWLCLTFSPPIYCTRRLAKLSVALAPTRCAAAMQSAPRECVLTLQSVWCVCMHAFHAVTVGLSDCVRLYGLDRHLSYGTARSEWCCRLRGCRYQGHCVCCVVVEADTHQCYHDICCCVHNPGYGFVMACLFRQVGLSRPL